MIKNKITTDDAKTLSAYMPSSQMKFFETLLKGEEGDFFISKMVELSKAIKDAPDIYETDEIELENKKAILHYFGGSYDAFIFEIDKNSDDMFGIASFGYGYELGYISLSELKESGCIELDLYYNGDKDYLEKVS